MNEIGFVLITIMPQIFMYFDASCKLDMLVSKIFHDFLATEQLSTTDNVMNKICAKCLHGIVTCGLNKLWHFGLNMVRLLRA